MIQPSFNPAVATLDTPAIPMALSWAEQYDGSLGPLIDLSQAVPNYPPHPDLLKKLSACSASVEFAGYGDIEGEAELRTEYATQLRVQYQPAKQAFNSRAPAIQAGNVHITSGCNQAFVAALMSLAGAGDSVVMTNPCYFNHEATARMLGIHIRYADCESSQSFLPDVAHIESLIDSTVRVVALVSPNNPTGAVYPARLLGEIFAVCQKHGIWLLVDETYRDFLDRSNIPHHTLFQKDSWEQTFVQLYSFSKSFCIPGHRLGAIAAGHDVVLNVAKVMDNLQICAHRAAQQAVADQIPCLDNWIQSNTAEINRRAKTFTRVMRDYPDWKIHSMGAYFAYVEHPFDGVPASTVARLMASEFGVLPLPGSFFGTGQRRFLRMAFANADSTTIVHLGDRLKAMMGQSEKIAARFAGERAPTPVAG